MVCVTAVWDMVGHVSGTKWATAVWDIAACISPAGDITAKVTTVCAAYGTLHIAMRVTAVWDIAVSVIAV